MTGVELDFGFCFSQVEGGWGLGGGHLTVEKQNPEASSYLFLAIPTKKSAALSLDYLLNDPFLATLTLSTLSFINL